MHINYINFTVGKSSRGRRQIWKGSFTVSSVDFSEARCFRVVPSLRNENMYILVPLTLSGFSLRFFHSK